jgi:hypothetical protein
MGEGSGPENAGEGPWPSIEGGGREQQQKGRGAACWREVQRAKPRPHGVEAGRTGGGGIGPTASSSTPWRAEGSGRARPPAQGRCRQFSVEEQHARAPRKPTGRGMDGSRPGGGFSSGFGFEGGGRPPAAAVGRPPPAAAGVEGRGEGEVWWRRRGRPGVASGATRRRLGFPHGVPVFDFKFHQSLLFAMCECDSPAYLLIINHGFVWCFFTCHKPIHFTNCMILMTQKQQIVYI